MCVDEWRRGLSVTNRKVKFCLLFSVWILSFVRTDVHVCGLDGSKQLGDVFSMLIVACYIFLHTWKGLFAKAIICGCSWHCCWWVNKSWCFWNLHENNIKRFLALFWASLKEFLLTVWWDVKLFIKYSSLILFLSHFLLRYWQDSQIRIQKIYSRKKLTTKWVKPVFLCPRRRRIWIQILVQIAAARRIYQKGPFYLSLKQ